MTTMCAHAVAITSPAPASAIPKEKPVSEAIEVRGYVTMYCKPKTVGDLRAFMQVLDSYYLPDDMPVEDGVLSITREGAVDPIQCGCSVPGKSREWYVDAILMMHDCEQE